jgi:hypothetical protein
MRVITNHWKSLQPYQARFINAFSTLKPGTVVRLL